MPMKIKQENFTLMSGRVTMRRGYYNPTSDAVWLAAAAPRGVQTVLDVGIGSGGVSLCLWANNPDVKITGIDVSPQMLDACRINAELNNVNIELLNADITQWRTNRTFDLVVTNPPYFSGTPARHNAHHNADLDVWVSRCIARVRPMGTFCIITDATTVPTVMSAMARCLGDITVVPLFGARDTAERVLLSGRLGTRGVARIHRGFPMNYEPVLRDGLTIADILNTLGQK